MSAEQKRRRRPEVRLADRDHEPEPSPPSRAHLSVDLAAARYRAVSRVDVACNLEQIGELIRDVRDEPPADVMNLQCNIRRFAVDVQPEDRCFWPCRFETPPQRTRCSFFGISALSQLVPDLLEGDRGKPANGVRRQPVALIDVLAVPATGKRLDDPGCFPAMPIEGVVEFGARAASSVNRSPGPMCLRARG